MAMKLCILTVFSLFSATEHAFAEIVVRSADNSIELTIPDTYHEDMSHIRDQIAPLRQFLRLGGKQTFYNVFPSDSEPAGFWKDEVFKDDISAFIRVGIIPLGEFGEDLHARIESARNQAGTPNATQAFHEQFCEDFKASWGSGASCYYDRENDVGNGVNVLGAFVANSYRVVGEHVLLIGSMDMIGMLELYSHEAVVFGPSGNDSHLGFDSFESWKVSSDEKKWVLLLNAANSQDVVEILQSARQVIDSETEE